MLSGSRGGVLDLQFVSFPTYWAELRSGDPNEVSVEEKGYALFLTPEPAVQQSLDTGRPYGGVEFIYLDESWYLYHRFLVVKPE